MTARGRRRRPGRVGLALVGSVAVHAVGALLLWAVSSGSVPKAPAMRVYKVDIVSPPPSVAGPAMAEPPVESPAGPAPAPASTETPTTQPPAPKLAQPAPPKPAPAASPKPPTPEPEALPAPTRKPPAPTPPRPTQPATPSAASNPRPTTTANRPAPPKPAAPSTQPTQPSRGRTPEGGAHTNAPPASARPGQGTTGPGTKPVPATGANPVASSAAGEGLNVRTDGADFVDRAYLENIIRQVRRYFRPPAGARSDRATVRFWIARDGSVSDMDLVGGSGSFAFKSAALEAVERAGRDGAFGRLPQGFPDERLAVTFDFSPPR